MTLGCHYINLKKQLEQLTKSVCRETHKTSAKHFSFDQL